MNQENENDNSIINIIREIIEDLGYNSANKINYFLDIFTKIIGKFPNKKYSVKFIQKTSNRIIVNNTNNITSN